MTTAAQRNRYIATEAMLEELPRAIRAKRADQGLSLRAAAEQIGISWTTLRSVEESLHHTRVDVIKACLAWLGH